MNSKNNRVIFLTCHTNQEKLKAIGSTIQKHFENKEAVLIYVQESKAAEFIDHFLWSATPTSFIPHSIATEATKDFVVITTLPRNLNDASILFNLASMPCSITSEFAITYELMDKTTPEKLALSLERKERFVSIGYDITESY